MMTQSEKVTLLHRLHIKGEPLIIFNIWDAGSALAMQDAGASGFFVPGLTDAELIGKLCKHSPMPVNIMVSPGIPESLYLVELGVSRISYGSNPYCQMIEALKSAAVTRL